MSDDEHSLDLGEDTNLDVQDGDADEATAEAEAEREEAAAEAEEERRRQDIEHKSVDRETDAKEQENPDAHRDEEPYQS
jgi:hypothetical protein